ncbi:MAG: helix-hairpin-helix domain-containing protein, partial [Candidatus Saccharimonadales bacterium]
VRQYFQNSRGFDNKTLALVNEIDDTDWVETESEIDALFLESEMVKRYMPRYNILLRDDKSQLYIRIDMKSEWPYVSFTRNPGDDEADYYGPYYNGFALKKAFRYLRKIFPYYTKPPKVGERPSLDAHLGLEPYGLTTTQYKTELKKLISYVKGNRVQLVRELEADMKQAAAGHEFERAALLRNRLQNIKELQRRIMFGDKEFIDLSKDHALSLLTDLLSLQSAPVRIEGYDISHMSGTNVVASQVVFLNGVSSRSDYRKYKMIVQRNDDYANMYETLHRRFSEKNIKSWGLPHLVIIDGGKGQLESALKALVERDVRVPTISIAKREEEMIIHRLNSHINTTKLEQYRKHPEPGIVIELTGDYYVVNLHPGQRNASGHSKNLRAGGAYSPFADVVKLFQRIRDESHRFAISYHTVLKRQKQTASSLEDIPGVGPVTRRKLIRAFGSVRGIHNVSDEALSEAVGLKTAALIRKYLVK